MKKGVGDKSSGRSRNKVENDDRNDNREKMTEGKSVKVTKLEDDKLYDQRECPNVVKRTVVSLDKNRYGGRLDETNKTCKIPDKVTDRRGKKEEEQLQG